MSLLLSAAHLSIFTLALNCSVLYLLQCSGLLQALRSRTSSLKWVGKGGFAFLLGDKVGSGMVKPKRRYQIPVLSRIYLIMLHHTGRGCPFLAFKRSLSLLQLHESQSFVFTFKKYYAALKIMRADNSLSSSQLPCLVPCGIKRWGGIPDSPPPCLLPTSPPRLPVSTFSAFVSC